MKTELPDINLKELRDFIRLMDEHRNAGLADLSYVSLKLRLQFILGESNFTSFDSFLRHAASNETFRKQLEGRIKIRDTELFRDAASWLFLSETLKRSGHQPISICLFETGNFAELATLLFFLEHWQILHNVSVTVIDLLSRGAVPRVLHFSHAQIETAALNFAVLRSGSVEQSFTKKEKEYEFRVPEHARINVETMEQENTFDVLIARNITPVFNFQAHQNLFSKYRSMVRPGGVFFAGKKESFSWCKGFDAFIPAGADMGYYIRK